MQETFLVTSFFILFIKYSSKKFKHCFAFIICHCFFSCCFLISWSKSILKNTLISHQVMTFLFSYIFPCFATNWTQVHMPGFCIFSVCTGIVLNTLSEWEYVQVSKGTVLVTYNGFALLRPWSALTDLTVVDVSLEAEGTVQGTAWNEAGAQLLPCKGHMQVITTWKLFIPDKRIFSRLNLLFPFTS